MEKARFVVAMYFDSSDALIAGMQVLEKKVARTDFFSPALPSDRAGEHMKYFAIKGAASPSAVTARWKYLSERMRKANFPVKTDILCLLNGKVISLEKTISNYSIDVAPGIHLKLQMRFQLPEMKICEGADARFTHPGVRVFFSDLYQLMLRES